MLKHIKISVVLLLISLPFLIFGAIKNHKNMYIQSRGNYFFENTKNIPDLNKIIITKGDDLITIIKQDNLWRIKEANYYFANFAKINSLVDKIYNTVVYRADVMNNNSESIFNNATTISTYNSNDDVIDNASISVRDEKNKYHYAKLNDTNILYQITGDMSLSSYFMDWVQMPIISFSFNEVKKIKADDYVAYRRFNNEELKSIETNKENPYLREFISNLWNLNAEEIIPISRFDNNKYKMVREFTITTFDGEIANIKVYSDNEEFWMSIQLNADKLITQIANKQLKENKILYDGWFFKINKDIGINITKFVF